MFTVIYKFPKRPLTTLAWVRKEDAMDYKDIILSKYPQLSLDIEVVNISELNIDTSAYKITTNKGEYQLKLV
jgi:hypothetical protein